jgi:hypothetical protein
MTDELVCLRYACVSNRLRGLWLERSYTAIANNGEINSILVNKGYTGLILLDTYSETMRSLEVMRGQMIKSGGTYL